ncbi:unnamed protein product [Closterium sp. NIES-53]
MDAEMASWKSTGSYVDEVPPPGAKIVSGMWIFRVKRPPGSPPVFKARYVARGFSQRQGVDFFHTFSPTPKMTTLRVLLHVAAQRDYELHSLDFSTAFLQGSLHEEIWLRCPPGFTGSFPAGTQWSLQRPVYGLCQAPREWHDTLRTTLAALGFAPSTSDPSLFLRTDTTLRPFYVLVYVDDLVFATADTEALAHVKSKLQKRHTCTDLGEVTSYLGLRITRDRAQRTITLTQSHMVQQVLQRFNFTYSSPQSIPLPTGHSLSAPPSEESVEPSGPYPELVGCLMYLMTCTRPDLAYPLSLLARYVAPDRHRKVHWDATKRVLRYLCSTSGMGIVLGGRARVVLTGHADASWVDDLATQRSSQGYTFSLGSGSVSWRSTRSSSELRWLTYLLTDLGEAPRSPPVLYVDNKAMLALCQEHRLEHRTKHIALRYFIAQELQQLGQLCLAYVATRANTADIFTKALQPCDHQRFCTMLAYKFDSVLNGELYQLKTHPRVASSNVAQGSKATLKVWHNRLAHANYDSVKELANKGLAKGFDVAVGDDESGVCAACVEGKMARKPFGSRTSPLAKDPLALVHMDVCGPMRHTSKGGARFLLVMLDDATRMCWTWLLKAKGDVTKAIQEWALEFCDDDKKRIKAIRNDSGSEFVNAELEKWMKSKGIKHGVTTPYTPQHNGAAERLNCTLVEAVPSQVEKKAENGGGENEESDDDVVEVPSTVAATSSTPSSLPLALTREQRIHRPNTKYTNYATVAVGELDEERAAYCFATLGDGPRTHTEALASPDAPLWKQAMEKELASIKENDVFELVDPPKGAYLVGCKWVLKKKLGADGSVECYKARLVAQGYTQREGEHYSETFAPVAKAITLRVLLALAASLNLEVKQLDVCTAFLYGLLKEEVCLHAATPGVR